VGLRIRSLAGMKRVTLELGANSAVIVDRDADLIEHLLDPEIVEALEEHLPAEGAPRDAVPPSPHEIRKRKIERPTTNA
jgi:Mn-dependent DtxR family transcriptional regulator